MNRFKRVERKKEADQSVPQQPLREFTDDSQETDPSMHLFRLEVTAYWLLPLLIFCTILFGGIYLAIKFDVFGDWSGDFEATPPYYTTSGEIVVSQLLNYHLDAIGGREALEGIRSVRYKGSLVENAGEIAFQILISVPDKGMIITNPGEDISQKLVLNGDTAWQVVELGDGERKVITLDEANTASLAWSLKVHNSFRRQILEQGSVGFTAQETEYEGMPAIKLTKKMPDGSDFVAVLDKKSLYLMKSVETVPGVEGPERVETVYADHREESGVVFAYETKAYKQGQFYNQTIMEYVQLDPGLVSSLFAVPEEVSK